MRIKICGITNEADAMAAAQFGADAIGLNFYARSPRFVPEERAATIARSLPPFVEPVALFVDELFEHMAAAVGRLRGINTVQFHGSKLAPCPAGPLRYIPAFGIDNEDSLGGIMAYVARCRQEGQMPAAILVDAHAYGGTGRTAPWDVLAGFDPGVPLILAGGLTADNVAEAIRRVRPFAVDVASGVESSPGQKDIEKMRRFIGEARSCTY